MIIIGHPFIDQKEGGFFLNAVIKDEILKKEFLVWYSVDEMYGQYLCDDRADAFLLIAMMSAMKSHQDVLVNAPVSKRLLYHINNEIQPLFKKLIPGSCCIQIRVPDEDCPRLYGNAVGCGCSLGVDSLSALYRHMDNHMINEYRVSHLAFFNSGQLGYLNQELDESSFRKAVEGIVPFSKEVNLPIVVIDSNVNTFFVESGFKTASSRIVMSTLSCALALQKLFGKYIYASSTPVQSFELYAKDQSFAEIAYVSLLSTEGTEFILSDSAMTRVEKTDYIRKNPLTPKYLDVCWATQVASSISHDGRWLEGKMKKNCGWCDKCLRTLFTLELLGDDLSKYEEIFDLSKYYAHKNDFIKTVIGKKIINQRNIDQRNINHMYSEIYDLMSAKNFKVPRTVVFSLKLRRIKSFLKRVRGFFKFDKKS